MLDLEEIRATKYRYFDSHSDCPHHPFGFRGTFAFSAHELVPEPYHEFLLLSFGVDKITKISLEQINALMNREWDTAAPSPMRHIYELTRELRLSGRDIRFSKISRASLLEEDDTVPDLPLFDWDPSDSDSEEEA